MDTPLRYMREKPGAPSTYARRVPMPNPMLRINNPRRDRMPQNDESLQGRGRWRPSSRPGESQLQRWHAV
jgi:hypothetical protein